MMEHEFPLQWPAGQPRTAKRDRGKFTRTLTNARLELIKQIQSAGGSNIVISSNYGGLSGKNPDDPGVAIYFNRRGKRLGMGCDRWLIITHNLCALANTIEAMRGIERWGCGHLMERAFSAFEALPPPSDWKGELGFTPHEQPSPAEIEDRYRELAKQWHPDRPGGNSAKFIAIQTAKAQAIREIIKQ